jgi:hypothetical protein
VASGSKMGRVWRLGPASLASGMARRLCVGCPASLGAASGMGSAPRMGSGMGPRMGLAPVVIGEAAYAGR